MILDNIRITFGGFTFKITQETKFSLLIDIQQKIQEGKGEAYENWAIVYNLKQAARTLIYLKDNGIDSYDDLVKKSNAASSDFNDKLARIKEIEKQQKEISELQRQIGTYLKTKKAWGEWRRLKKYQQTRWEKFRNATHPADDYYEDNRADITLCQAAKKYFDEQGFKGTLPPIATLKQEWATLESEKKILYRDYHKLKGQRTDLAKARDNCERLLGINRDAPERAERAATREQKRSHAHER